ncbi:MAG: hypothetical protein JWM33_1506 [Caulobacteraceae bacterium]|nr:hypothetical protein [Caulobacteraceae bacterium]
MKFDLDQLAKRLTDAAARTQGLEITVSTFDLILAKDGHGTNRCESVPFAALFLSDKDVLGEALNRLGQEAAPNA